MTGKSIFELLDAAGISWKVYNAEPVLAFANEFAYVSQHVPPMVFPIGDYFTDAAAGTLPQVAFVDPILLGPRNVENDEHPPTNVQVGQNFVATVLTALFNSPNWSSSAFFLTYDEHGGYFDHVPPPAAIPPDAAAPMASSTATIAETPIDQDGFDQYGIRVPAVVVSPFARSHFVSHVVHDHTSILRFIETRFGLSNLTQRDLSADPMLEFFDFKNPPFLTPPALPAAAIDPVGLAECQALESTAPNVPTP
jgi:phospholipase C